MEAKSEWDDYCQEQTTGFGAVVDQFLEEIKERIVDRECSEVLIGISESIKE